jgi:hypothetical protein
MAQEISLAMSNGSTFSVYQTRNCFDLYWESMNNYNPGEVLEKNASSTKLSS